jgi:hypothetical protein
MRIKCLAWAKEYVKWTAVHWDSVTFSDDSKFNLHGSDGKQHAWHINNETYHPDYIEQAINFQ